MLEIKDLNFSNISIADNVGRVFFYKKNIYRIINKTAEPDCYNLLNSELFAELIRLNFIPKTTISNLKIEGYDLVLQHEKLLVTEAYEWTFTMLKNATKFILDLNQLCNRYGYELKDAHTSNILFKNGNPLMVDFGSIVKRNNSDSQWRGLQEFYYSFITPLLLWQRKELYFSRLVLADQKVKVFPSQSIDDVPYINQLLKPYYYYSIRFLSKKIINCNSEFIVKISNEINKITNVFFTKKKYTIIQYRKKFKIINVELINKPLLDTQWNNYHNDFYNTSNYEQGNNRFSRLITLLNLYCSDGKTMIDLAGNQGYFSSMVSTQLKLDKIIISDYDENALDLAFKYTLKNKLNLDVVLLNFMLLVNVESTINRLKSDIVVALAVTHHLILSQNYAISAIFERISNFSNKYVMIEFMPLGLWNGIDQQDPLVPQWYNFEWFKNNFECYFNIIVVEEVAKNRIVFLGIKK